MKTELMTIAAALAVAGAAYAAAPDFRPPFDKSDYKGTVGVQVNPWFPLNKPPSHALGGPNVPWTRYGGKDLWAQGMQDLLAYGIDMWVPEMNEPVSWVGTWRDMLVQAATNGVPVRIGMFFGFYSPDADSVVKSMKKVMGPYMDLLKSSPKVARAGGYPTMVVYNTRGKYTPEEFGRLFARIDAECGRMLYLFDAAGAAWKARQGAKDEAEVDANFERIIREKLPYFDGISSYANGYRVPMQVIRKVMKDFPQKIFEGQVHQTYTCHFQTGGNEVDLSRNWRESIDECLEADPDSILLTNLFDHYENSLVLPCYDREDFLLRYFECRTAAWRKKEFRRLDYPELIVTGYAAVLLGRQSLDFEVIGLPISNRFQDVMIELDLCDASGKVLKTFPAKSMKLDRICVERFSAPSEDFASERGVVPRLRYSWAGGKRAMNYGPLTLIDPSIRPYRLYWARSTKNELKANGENAWTMDGVAPGGTHRPRRIGESRFASRIQAVHQGDRERISSRYHLVYRDNVELYMRDDGKDLNSAMSIPTPNPGDALHWYYLQMENAKSRKFQTLPIWEEAGTRPGTVKIPFWAKDGAVAEREIEKVRVPFWHYTLEQDDGKILTDVSGWGHNAAVRGSGFGGGHLGYTGYNHYHNGPVGQFKPGEASPWHCDADGKGYLSFNGSNDYVVIHGGTAFPGAFTYELKVRPAEFGREAGLLGTCNGQISVDVLADGRVKVVRKNSREGAGGKITKAEFSDEIVSKAPLALGEWTRLAVVYDLRKLTLFFNGEEQGTCASTSYDAGHEWLNFLMVGARCQWVWTPVEHFKGDIGEMRFYGRNLWPAELLK